MLGQFSVWRQVHIERKHVLLLQLKPHYAIQYFRPLQLETQKKNYGPGCLLDSVRHGRMPE